MPTRLLLFLVSACLLSLVSAGSIRIAATNNKTESLGRLTTEVILASDSPDLSTDTTLGSATDYDDYANPEVVTDSDNPTDSETSESLGTEATDYSQVSTDSSLPDSETMGNSEEDSTSEAGKSENSDCSIPAFLSFPSDIFNVTKNPGFVWIHIIVAAYLFIAIAVICDEYFCPSLDVTAQRMGLSEDVAGATLMSFGSSAPELFISIVAVFVGSSDVGTGTIVGSAVFNILFVIGVCGIMVSQACTLSWWAFIRDSVCYILAILVLLFLMIDNNITWWESLLMLLLYSLYIVLMKYNGWAHAFFVSRCGVCIKKDEPDGAVKLDGYKSAANNGYNQVPLALGDAQVGAYSVVQPVLNGAASLAPVLLVDEEIAYGRYALKLSFEDACWRFMITWQFRPVSRFRAAGFILLFERRKLMQYAEFASKYKRIERTMVRGTSSYAVKKSIIDPTNTQAWRVAPPRAISQPYISWLVSYPIRFVTYYTIVDCRLAKFERFYVLTFLLSILWISVISYILVWLVTLIGFVFGVPDAVMGITLLAAGTSVSDCVSSVIVARKGFGDMAVSNSFGSNVFDILIGLGLPWFIQTALVSPGSSISINSRGLIYDAILLFAAIFGTLFIIYLCEWRLNKKLGYFSMGLYLVFLTFSLMIEYNVLGYVNPPMCLV